MRVTTKTRRLRQNATNAERLLWARLRNRQLGGYKIRRQVEIGPYIVDFLCPAARVVIEVDGGQHAIDRSKDELRDRWLEEQGYQVVRFWNNEVLANPGGVLETLMRRLQASHPSPPPSPRERGEGEKWLKINPLLLAGEGGARRRRRREGEGSP